METLGNKNQQKSAQNFYCKSCNYNTSRKCNFDDHNLSAKHKKTLEGNVLETFISENQRKSAICNFSCEKCNKEFKTRSGLWKHNKICICENNKIENTVDKKDELIDYLMKENKEIKELILELAKKDSYNNCNNTVNSHNKAFNLNFFLNETCKDAMNIMDFVDSIKLQLSDLEKVGELGYVEGISNIIVKNLKELDVTQRPVHCTDKKRETMYVKDENKWEKDEEKLKLHKVVRKVTYKNQNLIPDYKKEHPDYNKSSSKISDKFNKIVVESMGGSGDNDFEKEEKIIKNISKQVFIDKEETI
jgi:hypothetical protein